MRLFGVVCLSISSVVFAQTYTISTFAGGGPPDNVPANSIALNGAGVASDQNGNLFIATGDGVFRLDATTGTITKIFATAAGAIAADSAGSVYISVGVRPVVKKISNGVVTTVAGSGAAFAGFTGDNGPATNVALMSVSGLAVDAAGNLYIADSGTHRIRKVSNGVITTIAGSAICGFHGMSGFGSWECTPGFSGDNASATAAKLSSPIGVALDASGNVYFADSGNSRIREVSNGVITTIAGGGTDLGDNVAAIGSQLSPVAVSVDSANNLYVGQSGDARVRKVSNGIITTVAGNGTAGFSGDNGPAVNAQINGGSIALDAIGNLYIGGGARVRRVTNGIITTVAGNGAPRFSGDGGPPTGAQLAGPNSVAVHAAGNVYFTDRDNHRVLKVSNGVMTTVAGNGTAGFSGDNGPATSAQLNEPTRIAVDSANNLYFVDSGVRIRKVSNGVITTVAGNGTAGFSPDGVLATNAAIIPREIAVDRTGTLHFADSDGQNQVSIRKISNGVLVTVAGTGVPGLSGDNGPATSAQLDRSIEGIGFDSAGNLYIAETGRVREVSNGIITTVFVGPSFSMGVDAAGNLYLSAVTTANGIQVFKVSGGAAINIAGNGTVGFSGDGGPALQAQLSDASGIAVDSAGDVYIADAGNRRVRVLTPASPPPPPVGPDLTITETHTGEFTQAQLGATYTITVGNRGPDSSSGTVTVTNTGPPELIITATNGIGWNCTQPAGPCTRADALAPGSHYPPITVTANVAIHAPISVNNRATVTGGGELAIETVTNNDTATDFTVVNPSPPRISSVSPNPASSLGGLQTIFINGIGFSNVSTVRLTGPNGQTDVTQFDIGRFGTGQLSVTIDPGGAASTWTVQVILLNGQTSNTFPFKFAAPTTTTFALPQFVFGGAWYTALYFSNTTPAAANVTLKFIGDDGAPLNVTLAGIGLVSTYPFSVTAKSTVILEALNNAGNSGQGWVEATLPTGVVGHAVFRQVVPGRADQEAVVPLTPESSQIADLTYDETAFSTAAAFLNPTDQPVIVTISAFGSDGSPAGVSQVPLNARSKLATVLRTLPGLEGMLGKRGRAVFSVSSGAVSVLGLRFGGSAFTSIPVVHRPAVPDANTTTFALPQFAFGDPWYTAIYLSNTTSAPQSVPVSFIGNDGSRLNANLVGIGTAFFRMVTLNPGATEILEAPNTGSAGEGWAEATLPPGVTGYAVFRQVVPGRFNQEAVVPLTSEANLAGDMIYDDVQFTTCVAILNSSATQSARVTITAYSETGAQVGTAQMDLQPDTKVATILRNLPGLTGMTGNRGWVTFSSPFGNVSLLGLRFGAEAFTSIPVTSR